MESLINDDLDLSLFGDETDNQFDNEISDIESSQSSD